jgi:hypothetical protein
MEISQCLFVEQINGQSQLERDCAPKFPVTLRSVRFSLTNASIALMLRAALAAPVAVQEVREAMIAIIVITFLAFIGAAFTIYLSRRTLPDAASKNVLPAPRFRGFLDRSDAGLLAEEEQETAAYKRQLMLELARTGELSALNEVHATHDVRLYADVLKALVEWASERQENLTALVSHISKSNEFRANKQLAKLLIETWKTAPDRRSTTEMIHIAALSDDADTYEQALEAAIKLWRSGKLSAFKPEELIELLVSQYWVIAPEARRGGAGFALKRRLGSVRRELATATPAS